MPLTPGSRLGPYEIVAAIGAGGMGEVYRATDTKLKRQVAIKILPPSVAADHERLARFQREAEVLASLNHPHIAGIYGLEDSGGVVALVMELVEGEDLSQRIARGAIPLDEALPIARQIAEALEAAHEQGIIHRDLKPANIKVRPDGTVKVLDFGLAKALDTPPSGGSSIPDPAYSPTITTPAMTLRGVILGTAAYMAPEQAKGKPVDKRGDIWAFGVVVYEMLSGRRGFHAEDVSETLAAVLTREVDWSALPGTTPPRLCELLIACLVRDPKLRLRDIGDARIAIVRIESGAGEVPAAPGLTVLTRTALPWIAAGLLAAALAGTLALWAPWRRAPTPSAVRLKADLGVTDASLVTTQGDTAVMSPDGRVLAFTAVKDGRVQIYVRRLDQFQASPLPGTDGARGMFFSPDGQWIGFFAGGKLRKVGVTGGAAVVLCDAPDDRGGSWTADGSIVFVPSAAPGTSIQRVPVAGGTPEVLVTIDSAKAARFPRVLPGGRALFYTSGGDGIGIDASDIVVQPLPSGPSKVLVRGGYDGRYVPSGHFMYVRDSTVFAAPFDVDRGELTGPPVPALEGIVTNTAVGSALFSISSTGTLVYLPGQSVGASMPMYWATASTSSVLRSTPANWSNPAFSPDGKRLALDILDGRQLDAWIYEWDRDTLSRITFDNADDFKPVWTTDGRRLTFASRRAGREPTSPPNLYWQRADGGGDAERLTTSPNGQVPGSWHPSGRYLAFSESDPKTASDIRILPMEGDEASGWKPGQPTTFLNSPFVEQEPVFSPDGRWLAYVSNESGAFEVYVRPFPGPGGKWQISNGGGIYPAWSRTRSELLFSPTSRQLMSVTYSVEGDSFRAEKPRAWTQSRALALPRQRHFALHPDGQRVALFTTSEAQSSTQVNQLRIVFSFFDELRRIAPVTK